MLKSSKGRHLRRDEMKSEGRRWMQTQSSSLLSVGIGRPVGYIAWADISVWPCVCVCVCVFVRARARARVCVMLPSGGFALCVCALVGIPYFRKKNPGQLYLGGEDKIVDPLWNI
jgi:hypothetical protein